MQTLHASLERNQILNVWHRNTAPFCCCCLRSTTCAGHASSFRTRLLRQDHVSSARAHRPIRSVLQVRKMTLRKWGSHMARKSWMGFQSRSSDSESSIFPHWVTAPKRWVSPPPLLLSPSELSYENIRSHHSPAHHPAAVPLSLRVRTGPLQWPPTPCRMV